ncbi:hypothetical protein MUK42_35749 [Musa troglodytarum]|uniref:Uncharacterized protein n=1 Tax=Musa troglodytarum TaxID=320322 RepID=A0A9E7FJL5_9LILI|nr:hypothetical protein MUK42_35749 [Musa troglodytarum]
MTNTINTKRALTILKFLLPFSRSLSLSLLFGCCRGKTTSRSSSSAKEPAKAATSKGLSFYQRMPNRFRYPKNPSFDSVLGTQLSTAYPDGLFKLEGGWWRFTPDTWSKFHVMLSNK